MKIAKSVEKLVAYTPGEQPIASDVVKLNTNENPYLPSPKIAQVLANFNLDKLRKYPDPVFKELRGKIAEIYGCKPESVFVGNGSDEVLSVAARTFVDDDEAIGSFDPSYSLYKTLADIRNVSFVPSPLGEGFRWAKPQIDGVALFLLTNPNAPTSVMYDKEQIAAFASSFPGVMIIDEAYADFSGQSCVDLATGEGNENIIVMRTLSKSFSLAGLRLGFCIGPVDLIEAMYKVKDSYNVDAVAQAVALAALDDLPWMQENVRRVVATRERLAGALRSRGWQMPDSSSNFLFAKPAHKQAKAVFEELRQRNIFVRYFPGPRTGDRIRITVGTDSEVDRLIEAIDEIDVEG